MAKNDEYYLKDTIIDDKATIRIYSPIISEEERARRYKAIERAAAGLIMEKLRNEKARAQAEINITEL